MRQKHLKGKEMKPLCRLWKAILKSYKSAVLEYSSFQLFFIYLFIFIVHCDFSLPSERTG